MRRAVFLFFKNLELNSDVWFKSDVRADYCVEEFKVILLKIR